MSLETGTYISDLVATNPTSSDPKSAGDDHLRLLKSTIKTTFPNVAGAVTPTHTELNFVDGVTSAIQGQIDSKGAIAGQTWTGTHTFPATVSFGPVSATEVSYLDGVTGAIQTQIDTKGAITGQAWTGSHTFPTQSALDNSTKAATTAYADSGAAVVTAYANSQLILKGTIAGQTWTGTHNYTGATVTVATPVSGSNPTTKTYVDNLSFSVALPGQAGNAGKYVTTDGSTASWAEVYPSQTGNAGKVLSTNGTTTSWAASGISSVTNIVAATTLTAANIAYHTVSMTALGQSVTLPVATTLTVGTPKAVFKNTGGYPFGIRDSTGALLMGVAAGGVAYVSLDSASTAAGSWSVTGTNLEPGLTTIDSTFSSTYASTVLAPFVALDDNVSIHFAALASGFAAFVVDKVGGVVSTPVTVSATASSVPVQCFKVSSTSAIVFYGSSAASNACVILSLSGVSPSLTLTVNTQQSNVLVTASNGGAWSNENFVGVPKIAQLSSTLYGFSYAAVNVGNTMAMAISVSGVTITVGTPVTIIANANPDSPTTTYPLTATTFLVLYKQNSAAPYTNNAVVISVSGTTCTVGTPAVLTGNSGATITVPLSCLLSATKCMVVDNNNSADIFASAITITGTSLSVGTALSIEASVTGGGGSTGYTSYSATRYNPHLYPLTSSTALLWYFDSVGVSRCVVLSESGGTVTKGTIVYRSISGGNASSNNGMIFPQSADSFACLKNTAQASLGFSLKRLVAHKISGTSITVGTSAPLDAVSVSQATSANMLNVPAGRLSNGNYIFGIGGNDDRSGTSIPVFKTNGDFIDLRGYVKIPCLVGDSTATPVPIVGSNRVVLLGSTQPTGTTVAATTYQLRLLSIEVAA